MMSDYVRGFDVYLNNTKTHRSFAFTDESTSYIQNFPKSTLHLFRAFSKLLKISFSLFLLYAAVALYIRVFYMYLPVWFFLRSKKLLIIYRS